MLTESLKQSLEVCYLYEKGELVNEKNTFTFHLSEWSSWTFPIFLETVASTAMRYSAYQGQEWEIYYQRAFEIAQSRGWMKSLWNLRCEAAVLAFKQENYMAIKKLEKEILQNQSDRLLIYLHLINGEKRLALSQIKKFLDASSNSEHPKLFLEMLLLKAYLFNLNGAELDSSRFIEKALILSSKYELMMSFAESGKILHQLCLDFIEKNRHCPRSDISQIYLKKLSGILKSKKFVSFLESKKLQNISTESALTKREKEILNLADSGFSQTELAKRLFISPCTLRFHLKNIYRKLAVKNRSGAVLKARQLEMI